MLSNDYKLQDLLELIKEELSESELYKDEIAVINKAQNELNNNSPGINSVKLYKMISKEHMLYAFSKTSFEKWLELLVKTEILFIEKKINRLAA